MSAASEGGANGGYVDMAGGAHGDAVDPLVVGLADGGGYLDTLQTAGDVHQGVQVLVGESVLTLDRHGHIHDADAAIGEEVQSLEAQLFSQQELMGLDSEEPMVDVGRVKACRQKLGGGSVGGGAGVAVAETAGVRADGGIEQAVCLGGDGPDTPCFHQLAGEAVDHFPCRGGLAVDPTVGVHFALGVMVDHEVDTAAVAGILVSHLGGGGRVDRDDLCRSKIRGDVLGLYAVLFVACQEVKSLGELIVAGAEGAAPHALQEHLEGKASPDCVAVGVAVKEDKGIHTAPDAGGGLGKGEVLVVHVNRGPFLRNCGWFYTIPQPKP